LSKTLQNGKLSIIKGENTLNTGVLDEVPYEVPDEMPFEVPFEVPLNFIPVTVLDSK
jgi:hypothetical protein